MKRMGYSATAVLFVLILSITPLLSALQIDIPQSDLEGKVDADRTTIPFYFDFQPDGMIMTMVGNRIMIEKDGYDTAAEEGEPMIPTRINSFLIDPYAEEIELRITGQQKRTIPIPAEIARNHHYHPISLPFSGEREAPDIDIHGPVELYSDGYIRGYRIQEIRFTPVVPLSKDTIDVYTEISGEISFRVPDTVLERMDTVQRSTSIFGDHIEEAVSNPEDMKRFMAMPLWNGNSSLEEGDYQYVVITDREKVGESIDDLVDWKIRKGVPSTIVEMDFIKTNYTGRDTQEKVRNFIKDAVTTWETDFILLGGDISVVPYRSTYVKANGYESFDCAADLYYSDLDGDFNADNDSTWGEKEDNVDLRPDVIVGRAPAETPSQMEVFVTKTLRYELDPLSGYLDNVTLAGEYLDDDTNSSIGLDVLKNTILTPNVVTTSLYDEGKGDYGNLDRFNFMDQINKGLSYMFHEGHCNWNVMSVGTASNGNMYNSHVKNYNGGYKIGVLNTVGCITTRFSQNDCIAELHVMEADGGTVAYIGNSRYGWYAYHRPGTTYRLGPSEKYQHKMAQELYIDGSTRMGEHFAVAKDFYAGNSRNYNSMGWVQMALNLMGDPEPFVRTAEPQQFNISLPQNLGRSYSNFNISVKDLNGTPVQGALVCLDQTDYYGYNTTTSDGKAFFDFQTTSYDRINVTVTGYNFLPFTGNISVDMISPSIVINSIEEATTGELCTINCTVADEAGVDQVLVDYRPMVLSDDEFRTSVGTFDGRNHEIDIEIPWNSTEDLLYRIRAMDEPGNWNITDWITLQVLDNDLPVFQGHSIPETVATGETAYLGISASDNIGIESVKIDHFTRDIRSSITDDLVDEGNGTWTYEWTAPIDEVLDLVYMISIEDVSGNINSSMAGTIRVLDDQIPVFINDLSDQEGTSSDPIDFLVLVEDNLDVSNTTLEYWRYGDIVHQNISMDISDNGWSTTIMVPGSDLRTYYYFISASDGAGNWNRTSRKTIEVTDNDPPTLLKDWGPVNVTTGDASVFKVQVIDNIDVEMVWINISTMTNDPVEMRKGTMDNWSIPIDIPTSLQGMVRYTISSMDVNGNHVVYPEVQLDVIDNDPPVLGSTDYDMLVDAGTELKISFVLTDNTELEMFSLEWWIGAKGEKISVIPVAGTNNTYSTSVDIPLVSFGTLYFTISSRDVAGNTMTSSRFESSIIEHIPDPVDDDDDEPEPPSPGVDSDGDGMEDLWEFDFGLEIGLDDSELDTDEDGFTNLEEYEAGTDPTNVTDHPEIPVVDDNSNMGMLIVLISVLVILAIALALTSLAIASRRERIDDSTEMVLDEDQEETADVHVRHGHHHQHHPEHHAHNLELGGHHHVDHHKKGATHHTHRKQ